jgi:hypothetical protein
MNKFRAGLLVALTIQAGASLRAQKIDSLMNLYAESYPQEKIYVQFDKKVYNPGETIWFKAYIFSGIDPSKISKNFYAELSDSRGNILQRKVAPISESSASGSFDIPSGIHTKQFHFRAYTSWMLNFDTAFLFEKDIRILNTPADSSVQAPSEDRYFQFFPEGGEVIAGLENNIAFKATDQYGIPRSVQGVLKDASGKDVLEFSSQHDGMGTFLLSPEKGDVFYALWKDDKGMEHKSDFPTIKPSGVVLRVMNAKKKVFFSIARSTEDSLAYSHLTIIGHMNQILVYKASVNLQNNFISGGTIPTDQLPTGILQVTVFDKANKPLAERVVFVNNNEYRFSPEVTVEAKSLTKKGKNTIDIEVPDTLQTNLSVAITDAVADGINPGDDNIITRLLLTADIKGFVYHPNYYFSNSSDSLMRQLDLVLLTNGWRRFKWDDMMAGKMPVIKFPPEDYLSIKAEVLGIDVSRISRDESINMMLRKSDSSTQMLMVPKISGGKFGVSGLIFYDTARGFYQFNLNRSLSDQSAVLFSNGLLKPYKNIRIRTPIYSGWSAEDSALLRKNRFIAQETERVRPSFENKVQTLSSVTVIGREKSAAQKLDEQYASGMFSGGDAYTFDLVDDPVAGSYTDIFTYLMGKVAGLQITTRGATTTLAWRNSVPSLYMNEIQVDISQIKSTPVADIAMVKVYRPGTSLGAQSGSGGSIAIYTKKGAAKRIDPNIKGLEQTRLIGYSPRKEFFSPDYLRNPDLTSTEDLRSTLYWNPWILTDKSNPRVTIQFYNNDISTQIRVVLEGINAEGKLTRIEKIIQ